MASSATVALAFVVAALALGSAHAGAGFTDISTTWKRTLKQGPSQCECLKPNFACKQTLVYCLAGTSVNLEESAGCSDPTIPNNPECETTTQTPGTPIPCPRHSAMTAQQICAEGIPVAGSDPTPCNVCYNMTLVGTCDLRGQTARSSITCEVPSIPSCTPGEFITLDQFQCTASSPVAGPGGQFYFGTLGDLTKVKIPCTAFFNNNRCQYTIGVNNALGCKSYNAASQATVTIGTGILNRITRTGCPQPVGP